MAFEQLDVVRIRTTLEAASAPDASWLTAALVYERARDAVAGLITDSKLAREFEALFPRADLSLAAVPGYPALLCRQLQGWLGEVDAGREARALSPELALVDGTLRDDGLDEPPVRGPDGWGAATGYHIRWSPRDRRR